MPFGLKNAGVTYQHMMQNCLKTQIGKNVEVYVDDMVIKSKKECTLLSDIQETFYNLRSYSIKLNLENVPLGYQLENCWATWYQLEELKQIQRKYRPYLLCKGLRNSTKYNS